MTRHLIAAGGMLAGLLLSHPAQADDWPCTVALCLGGPSEPECQPPLDRLWRHLARGNSFPVCAEANSNGNRIVRNREWFDPCPAGTSLPDRDGTHIGLPGNSKLAPSNPADSIFEPWADAPSPRACVGQYVSSKWVTDSNGEKNLVNTYDQVIWQRPARSPNVIDVYVGGELFNRIRW